MSLDITHHKKYRKRKSFEKNYIQPETEKSEKDLYIHPKIEKSNKNLYLKKISFRLFANEKNYFLDFTRIKFRKTENEGNFARITF